MSAYADTSFLASLYMPDSNSMEAAIRMQRAPLPVFLSPLGELELVNALYLRLFRKEVLPQELREAYAAFRADLRNGVLVMTPLRDAVYTQSKRLAVAWTAKIGPVRSTLFTWRPPL